MNKKFSVLIFFIVFLTFSFFMNSSAEEVKKDPGTYLNFQDVPIFVKGNPLEGLSVFAVIPPYSIQNPAVNKKIQDLIQKDLSSIGKVILAKSEDVTGFGSGNLLNIQIGKLSTWDGKELPITRVSLNVETPVILSKTDRSSLPRVWTINTFVDAPFDRKSEEKTI